MCGIAGIYNLDQTPVTEESIKDILLGVKHRGPDDEGIFLDGNTGLGFVRLSIIDLSNAGHQPKLSSDERHVIVFNGEIYNYIELREELKKEGIKFSTQTDTEVLLNAYLFWGESCLHKLNGMWAFAIYDKQEKSVFASRDRFGVKPFYYVRTDRQFIFCSEIPPLLSFLKNKPEPNYQSIFDFLVFNRTDQTENTFFNGVKKLQHGTNLRITGNSLTIYPWYDLKEKVKVAEGFRSAEEFKKCFGDSVNLRLRSDVPVGVCLSGGLDSSSIVSTLMNSSAIKGLNTFSAVYHKGQTGDESEFIKLYEGVVPFMNYITPDAKTLAEDLSKFVKCHAEPIPSTSPYAQYKVMELAGNKVKVVIDGQGSDEHLAGYHYFFGFYFKDLLTHFKWYTLMKEIFYYLRIHRSGFALKTFIYFLLPKYFKTKASLGEKDYLNKEFTKKYSEKKTIVSDLYASGTMDEAFLNHFEYKLEHLLKWEDRNSMWFSIEARVPFLDYRLVERSLATKSNWKIRNGTTKFILREAMKGVLPEKIRLRRDKMGFVTPQEEWFKEKNWQETINGILNSDSFAGRNIINADKAKEQYKSYLIGEIQNSKEIWKWIHLELWFREFID
jgi:asparagine synthase (glutamine-hydrolysing)